MDRLFCVQVCNTTWQAEIIRGVLARHGISSVVLDNAFTGVVQVLVHKANYRQSMKILRLPAARSGINSSRLLKAVRHGIKRGR